MIAYLSMKLDTEKIKRLKEARGITYREIAKLMGLNSRQHVFDFIKFKRITGAEKFAKVFGVDPKDLIK